MRTAETKEDIDSKHTKRGHKIDTLLKVEIKLAVAPMKGL